MSRTIVLLHGWGYRPSLWQGLVEALGNRTVLAPALNPPHERLESWADEIASRLPEAGLLVGWSLGAMLALSLAARHPEKVSGLLLIGATPRFVADPAWPHGLKADVVSRFEADFSRQPERTLRRFLALQVLGDQDRTRLSSMLENHLSPASESPGLAAGLHMLAEADLRESLPSLAKPCLLLHGELDALMPVGAARSLHERLAGSRLKIVPDAGHAPYFAEPGKLAALIEEVELGLG